MQNQFKMATDQTYLEIFHIECLIDFTQVDNIPIFRRSDDPSNQNVYKTTADTAKFAASGYAKVTLNIYQVIDDANDLPAGSILLMNGRRYKTAAAQTSGSGEGGIALTETFAGSSYLELCSGCADSMADGATNTDTGSEIQTDGNFGGGFDLKRGEQLMLGSATKFDAQLSVVVDQVALFNDGSTPATVGVSSTAG